MKSYLKVLPEGYNIRRSIMKTPNHIEPEWYFSFFYSILCSNENNFKWNYDWVCEESRGKKQSSQTFSRCIYCWDSICHQLLKESHGKITVQQITSILINKWVLLALPSLFKTHFLLIIIETILKVFYFNFNFVTQLRIMSFLSNETKWGYLLIGRQLIIISIYFINWFLFLCRLQIALLT